MSIAEGIREEVKDINRFSFPVKLPLQRIASLFKGAGKAFSASPRKSKKRSKQINGSAIAFATPLIIFVVGGICLPKLSNLLEIPSLQTSQTLVSTQNISPIGWIWIGKLDSTSTNLRDSSINPSLVPSAGALVNVDKPVNLRTNVRYSHNSRLPTQIGILKHDQKLVILQVKRLINHSSNSSDTQIWAQVGRCNKTCGN